MKSTFSAYVFDKYFKKAYADLVASIGFVPEYNSSKIQKCFSVYLFVVF
jgi:hypothetical protein